MQEHPLTLTLGRRPHPDLPPLAFWRARNVEVVPTERGGLATIHGPGQLVASLVIDLRRRGLGVRRAVRAVEAGLIHWLAAQEIDAHRRQGAPGVWVGDAKIASLGLHIRRDVTLHGFALNLHNDLRPFDWFDACGIADAAATSVARETGAGVTIEEVALDVANSVLWSLYESSVDSDGEGR